MEMKFCPFCGANLAEGSAFCHVCGKKLPTIEPNSASQTPAAKVLFFTVNRPKNSIVIGQNFKISFQINSTQAEAFSWEPHQSTKLVWGPQKQVTYASTIYTFHLCSKQIGDCIIPSASIIVNGKKYYTPQTIVVITPADDIPSGAPSTLCPPNYVASPASAQTTTKKTTKSKSPILFLILVLLASAIASLYAYLFDKDFGPALVLAMSIVAVSFFLICILFAINDKTSKGLKLFDSILAIVAVALVGVSIYKSHYTEAFYYKQALRKDTEEVYSAFLAKYPEGSYHDLVAGAKEELIYKRSKASAYRLLTEYLSQYPNGVYRKDALAIVDAYVRDKYIDKDAFSKSFFDAYAQYAPDGKYPIYVKNRLGENNDQEDWAAAKSLGTTSAFEHYIKSHPTGQHVKEARAYIASHKPKSSAQGSSSPVKPKSKYEGNSLSNGVQPYANIYGRNYTGDGCFVKVNASYSSDVVVIIKQGSKYGDVVGHAYIRKGNSYTINLPTEGTYQVFFYYGKDWNPERKMKDGRIGGFDNNEQYGSDSPQYLERKVSYSGIEYSGIEYTLQSTINGNFSMKTCQESDVF